MVVKMVGMFKLLGAYMFGGKDAVRALRDRERASANSAPSKLFLGTVDVPIAIDVSTSKRILARLHFAYSINWNTGERGVNITMSGATGDAVAIANLIPYYHENTLPWIMGGEWELIVPIRITVAKKYLPPDFLAYLEDDWNARVITRKVHNPFGDPEPITPNPVPPGKPNVTPLRPVT